MESIWWIFNQLWKKKLVYKSLKIMPYSYRLSTPLSNFEANLNYKNIQDPAITIKLKLKTENIYLLIWTTTPWTLPANIAVAVGKNIKYAKVKNNQDGNVYILAHNKIQQIIGEKITIISSFLGKDLHHKKYIPPFNYFLKTNETSNSFSIITSSHVNTKDGTGIVHLAPAYGQEDYNICIQEQLPIIDPIDEEGCFTKKNH